VLGANLGSGLLGMLSTLRSPPEARRVTLGNFLFKLIGCAAVVPLIRFIEPVIASLGDEARQVVVFHLIFNIAIAAVFLFMTEPIARVAARLLPSRPDSDNPSKPRHLDPSALDTPALAMSCAAREALRIGDVIEQMLDGLLKAIRANDAALADQLVRLDDDVDRLYTAVKLYLAQISREALDERDGRRWAEIMQLTINLEHVGDILEGLGQDLRDKKIAQRLSFSEAGMQEIEEMHAKLVGNLRLGLSVFLNGDLKSAQLLIAEKERFRDLERRFAGTHLDRLSGQTVQSIETSALHLDVISDLRRINSFFCSTAYPILEQAGQLRRSRLRSASATGIFPAGEVAPPREGAPNEASHGTHPARHREAL
jgi:phosphate:Na+ symporter